MRIFVTGGAGFIGSALVRHLIAETDHEVLVFDALTYAGNLSTLASVIDDRRYRFGQGDVADAGAVCDPLAQFRPDIVTHLAAERHVDRSIDAPGDFIRTNRLGTYTMLAEALAHWRIGEAWQARSVARFDSTTSPPTKSMARSAPPAASPNRRAMIRDRPIPRPRPGRTIW